MQILKATLSQLKDIVPLFDAYRVFYKQTSDVNSAETFLIERLTNNDSIIFVAYIDEIPVGFTQLYPLFSSVSMQPMYLLNDLYVDSKHRNKGIGKALIDKAKELCRTENNKGLAIQTETTNKAQHLYERIGFVIDPDLHLFWTNK